MGSVFISHSTHDRQAVEDAIIRPLTAAAINVWYSKSRDCADGIRRVVFAGPSTSCKRREKWGTPSRNDNVSKNNVKGKRSRLSVRSTLAEAGRILD